MLEKIVYRGVGIYGPKQALPDKESPLACLRYIELPGAPRAPPRTPYPPASRLLVALSLLSSALLRIGQPRNACAEKLATCSPSQQCLARPLELA